MGTPTTVRGDVVVEGNAYIKGSVINPEYNLLIQKISDLETRLTETEDKLAALAALKSS
jgi:hypothetical protein